MRFLKDRASSRISAFLLSGVLVGGLPAEEGVWPQERFPGRIVGKVVDQEDGVPISGAELRIRGSNLLRTTNSEGTFVFQAVPPGRHVLETSHLSYRVRTDSILVSPEEILEVEVSLVTEPVAMVPLVISVRSRVLEVGGFYRRRDQGLSGTFLTREQIEERGPARLTDLFVSIPGARLAQRDGVVGPVVVFPRGTLVGGGAETCYPDIWLDGVIMRTLDLDQINPDQVAGLEVYRGAASPLRFSTDCGAILIWTHVPEKRGG